MAEEPETPEAEGEVGRSTAADEVGKADVIEETEVDDTEADETVADEIDEDDANPSNGPLAVGVVTLSDVFRR